MAKIVQMTETRMINEEGEIISSDTSRVINLPSEPPYVKMYIEDISRLFDVSQGPRAVLYQLVRKLDYDGFISLTPASRARIASSCGLGIGTFNNYLTQLCKAAILRNVGRGEYEMNPHLFAKGEWKDISKRRQAFQLSITYQDGKRIIKGNTINAEDEQKEFDLEARRQELG